MHKLLRHIINLSSSINQVHIGLLICVALIYLLIINAGVVPAMVFALIPLGLICLNLFIQRPLYSLLAFFILNYVIMGLNRYYHALKPGMIMSALALGILMLVLIQNLGKRSDWQRCRNVLTLLWGIWFIYCLLEVLNPLSLIEPWAITFPPVALYPLLFAVLIPILCTKHKHFRWILVIWAILTLLAAAKGYWQKNRGFDSAELYWLYAGNGASTHFISTGIRFFSFFTDAANFGSSMGLSLIVFGIAGFYVKKLRLKALFWAAAMAGAYGLLISGTRSAVAVPFVGLAVYLLLCRSLKGIIITGVILAAGFIFLKYTDIGNGNRLIRRMRSAFDREDASLMVRTYNKERIWRYMVDKPMGVGLGLSGGKAKRFRPDDPISRIPTDSWLVQLWVETGIVGLILYLSIVIAILYKGMRIATLEIQTRELKGILLGILAGICGILVTSYANEVLSYPNGSIVFFLMGLIFAAPYYDKELSANESNT